MRDIKSKPKIKEDVHSSGKVLLRLKDHTGMIVKKSLGYNTLSKLAKARVVANGADFLDGGSYYMFGKTHISNDIDAVPNSNVHYYRQFKTISRQPGIVLLNLTGKTVTDNYIPIYDEAGNIDRSVVIGWFNSNIDATGDDYLGIEVPNIKKGLFEGISRERRGYFDRLKANGTITHVAIMNGIGKPGVGNAEHQGSIVWQNICKELKNSTWCPPNTPGITDANEIAIFNESAGVEAYKINLETGEEVKTSVTKDAIGWAGEFNIRGAMLLFDTDKLAVIDNGDRCKIIQINGDGTYTQLYNQSISHSSQADGKGIFIYNGYLYFTSGQNGDSTSTSYIARMYRIALTNLGTHTQVYNKDSGIIGGLPSGWDINQVNVLAYHNNKFYIRKNGAVTDRRNDIIVCTDLADVSGTKCGEMTNDLTHLSVISTPTEQDILIGSQLKPFKYIDNTVYGINGRVERMYANDLTGTLTTRDITLNGSDNANPTIWMSKCYGNWWTLYELDQPMTKTDEYVLDVIYTISWKDV